MRDCRLSTTVGHALAALSQFGEPGSEPVTCRTICQHFKLPESYIRQVATKLEIAGLVRGTRGRKGGFVLAKRRREISLDDIVRAVDGQDGAQPSNSFVGFSRQSAKLVEGVLKRITADAQQRLNRIKLSHLSK
jgi:Rrf2 family transcriptional regulator, iron-sulfur cluster assembly transcription factor